MSFNKLEANKLNLGRIVRVVMKLQFPFHFKLNFQQILEAEANICVGRETSRS